MWREELKALVGRSLHLSVLKCSACEKVVARVTHPETAKVDSFCDQRDHFKETGHSSFEAIAHIIIYMNQADKDLANAISEASREKLDEIFKEEEEKPTISIPREDVWAALTLARDFRWHTLAANLDPVATRIAIKYLLRVDTMLSKDRITPEQDKAIDVYVEHLVKATPKG